MVNISRNQKIGIGVGAVAVLAYVGYRYEQNKKATAAAAAVAASSGYGYGAGYGYGYGQTGYGYGQPGVTYGYGASGGFYPTGYYGYGVTQPPGVAVPPGSPAPVPATTNAQWVQAAITQLQNDQYDVPTVTAALGAYIAGQEVTPAQVSIIDAAIGIEGYPPVAGANGDPPGIKTGGTTGGGQGGGTKVTVPNVKNIHGEQARQIITQAGLKEAQIPATTAKGKTTMVTSQSPAAGSKVNSGSTVTVHVKTL